MTRRDNDRFPLLLEHKPLNLNGLNLRSQSENRKTAICCSRSCRDADSLKGVISGKPFCDRLLQRFVQGKSSSIGSQQRRSRCQTDEGHFRFWAICDFLGGGWLWDWGDQRLQNFGMQISVKRSTPSDNISSVLGHPDWQALRLPGFCKVTGTGKGRCSHV